MKKNKKGKHTFINSVDISTVLIKLYKKNESKKPEQIVGKNARAYKSCFCRDVIGKKGIK